MKKIKLFFVLIFFVTFLIPAAVFATNSNIINSEIKISIDGKMLDVNSWDVKPYMNENYRLMVPVIYIAKELGANVEWHPETDYYLNQTVIVTKDDMTISITIGVPAISMYIRSPQIDATPIIINGRTMVPIKYFAEALLVDVEWDSLNNQVKLSTEMPGVEDPDSEEWNEKVRIMTYYYYYIQELYYKSEKGTRRFIYDLYESLNNLEPQTLTYKEHDNFETVVNLNNSYHDIEIHTNDINLCYARNTALRILLGSLDFRQLKFEIQKYEISGETENYWYYSIINNEEQHIYLDHK